MALSNDDTIRSVSWNQLFPWLILARVFRLAISARMLVLGAAGILLSMNYWSLVAMWCPVSDEDRVWIAPARGCPWVAVDNTIADHWREQIPLGIFNEISLKNPDGWHTNELISRSQADQLDSTMPGVWRRLSAPLIGVFHNRASASHVITLLAAGLGSLAIWALFGGAMARIAAVHLAGDEDVGLVAALRFAGRKWLSFFAAPLIPACGIVAAALPLVIFGLLLRTQTGMLIAALFWPIALIFGVAMTLLVLGLLFAWPLMWGTIATEGSDSFDAISRAYAYLFQRPMHYLFYFVIATVLGALGWLVVSAITSGVVGMTYWAAGWGAGLEQIAALTPKIGDLEGIGKAGGWIIRFWATTAKSLGVGYVYAFFWAAASGTYLLLRRDVDAAEMDIVFLEPDADETSKPLPPANEAVPAQPEASPTSRAQEQGQEQSASKPQDSVVRDRPGNDLLADLTASGKPNSNAPTASSEVVNDRPTPDEQTASGTSPGDPKT